ncbi:ABC transporter ATP-binding protein [Haloarcula nitratireducens]|uniref:ABC transporter ATP-binding protein n=1 Tax=Haloarcula nitratireducens TaxID=2487749 RepID=A0AAW4P8F2_9EURY|nr:ABC transporter ATP-binding protein [Halomicroarcula nitratireducens]MBX0293592.1 ABC transporter ATP-binding protein [Halomicroarcula nitratireducens]
MPALQTNGLTKRFGDVVAVDDLDLTVESGEVFGFLGPNGAGKSTTINLLLDFIRPTEGSVEVLGIDAQTDPEAVRRRVGVLPEGYGFDDPLLGREYLEWAIETKGTDDDPDDLLSLVGLGDDADRLAGDYSKGMQQRLAFAIALAGDPDLLILDEPSTGLDPNGIQRMREVVRDRAADGTTVFFSSHILSEVEAVCDRVGVMNRGELVAVDTIDGLRDSAGGHATVELECATPPTGLGVESLSVVERATVEGRTLVVRCSDPSAKVDVVTHVAERAAVEDILSETVPLETLFSELTGGGRDGGEAATADEPAEALQ